MSDMRTGYLRAMKSAGEGPLSLVAGQAPSRHAYRSLLWGSSGAFFGIIESTT
jgi:hypothetical protein